MPTNDRVTPPTEAQDTTYPTGEQRGYNPTAGLSKREYFASLFIQGMLSHPDIYKGPHPGNSWMEFVSRDALNLADQFIKEINKDADYPAT